MTTKGTIAYQANKANIERAFVLLHRQYIDRYRRLLKTHLPDHEREFIERRLGEEEDALLEIAQKGVQFDCPVAASSERHHAA